MSVEDFVIWSFCYIDDWLKQQIEPKRLRPRGFQPALSDSEVITMEVAGEFLGYDGDKKIWNYFKTHWQTLFPKIGSRSNFSKHASNLWAVKRALQHQLANELGALSDSIHLVDGFPMKVCQFARAFHSRLFRGDAAYGYNAVKQEKFYGFEGQIMIDFRGVVSDFTVVPANVDERDSLWDLTDGIHGLLIGDKGYIRPILTEELSAQGIQLQTPLRKNMIDPRPRSFVSQMMSARRLVETVIGQLTEQFQIEKIRARDLWHLTNRVTRKILAHTLGVFFNQLLGREPLQLADLVS